MNNLKFKPHEYFYSSRNSSRCKRDRLNQRQDDISDAGADLITSQQANAEAFTAAEKDYVITIDTSMADWQEKVDFII